MIEALIALVAAVFLLLIFHVGGQLTAIGGLAFCVWVAILVIEWIFGKLKRP